MKIQKCVDDGHVTRGVDGGQFQQKGLLYPDKLIADLILNNLTKITQ